MAKIAFKDIYGKHKNTPCIVSGNGWSLTPYLPKLKFFKEKGMILIGCNDAHIIHNVPLDYWVIANTFFTIESYFDLFNKSKSIVFYADSVDPTPPEMAEQVLKVDFLAYDERHLNGQKCGHMCCRRGLVNYPIPGNLTIHQELSKITGNQVLYQSGGSVAVHMIAFAVIMKCNPIYLIGFDLDYNVGYAGDKIPIPGDRNYFTKERPAILEAMKIIKESAELINIKIVALSGQPTFDIFEVDKSLLMYL